MNVMEMLMLCGMIGITLKASDHFADDVGGEQKKFGYIFAVLTVIMLIYVGLPNPIILNVALGIFLGLIFAKKVDHKFHILSAIIFFTLIISFYAYFHIIIEVVVLSAVCAYADEFVHEKGKFIILKYRPFLKILAILAFTTGYIGAYYLLAFFLFDILYEITGVLLKKWSVKSDAVGGV